MTSSELPPQEHSQILDPKTLLEDNKSPEASFGIQEYDDAKEAGELTEGAGCGDARGNIGALVLTRKIKFHASIAAAGDPDAMHFSTNHEGTSQTVVLQHFDGSTEVNPKGCGGLGEKEKRMQNNEPEAPTGIYGYVDHRIRHPDIFNQSYVSALQIAKHTDKPVLAGAIDHLTGYIHPFILLTHHGESMVTRIPPNRFNDLEYVYREGLPDLDLKQLPESLQEFLHSNRQKCAELARKYRNLAEMQKIQNPPAIVVTSSLLPTSTRYPHVFGELNTNFGVTLPIVKDGKGSVTGVNEDVFTQEVLAEVEYPIRNATNAQSGHGGHGFHQTHILIIETPSMDLSRTVGQRIAQEPWMQTWLALHKNKIWTASVVSGHTRAMEVFT